MYSELYSFDLDRRYEATLRHPTDRGKKWPFPCSGAANAFLALISPSMGHAAPGKPVSVGGANRPYVNPMEIGRSVMRFDPATSGLNRWIRLCAAMLGSEQYVSSLTALLELDWGNSVNERDISPEELRSGWLYHIWPLLGEIRPRIVCALTNKVWNAIIPEIEPLRVSFTSCPVTLTYRGPIRHQPVVFRLPGCDFNTLHIKPPHHPSWPNLTDDMISQVGEACQWFLSQ
jgi:hypothetical protein